MNKVYITDYIQNPDIEKEILGNDLCTTNHLDQIEVILVWHQKVDKNYLKRFPNLKAIIRYGVGFDNIDLESAQSQNITVCNTPDYGTDEVSDTAIAMIMNIIRGVSRYDYFCRSYKNNSWQENTISSIKRTSDYKLGVIGAGRIGSSVLLKANSLRIQTSFYDPYKPRGHEKTLNSVRYDSLSDILKDSDIISLHVPSTDETRSIINDKFLQIMEKGSSLVNTARGDLIDNLDIIFHHMKSGHINSVALDVLPDEPPSSNNKLIKAWRDKEEWLDGRLIINPHTSYFSKTAFVEMRQKAAINAKRVINGQHAFNIIC